MYVNTYLNIYVVKNRYTTIPWMQSQITNDNNKNYGFAKCHQGFNWSQPIFANAIIIIFNTFEKKQQRSVILVFSVECIFDVDAMCCRLIFVCFVSLFLSIACIRARSYMQFDRNAYSFIGTCTLHFKLTNELRMILKNKLHGQIYAIYGRGMYGRLDHKTDGRG